MVCQQACQLLLLLKCQGSDVIARLRNPLSYFIPYTQHQQLELPSTALRPCKRCSAVRLWHLRTFGRLPASLDANLPAGSETHALLQETDVSRCVQALENEHDLRDCFTYLPIAWEQRRIVDRRSEKYSCSKPSSKP